MRQLRRFMYLKRPQLKAEVLVNGKIIVYPAMLAWFCAPIDRLMHALGL